VDTKISATEAVRQFSDLLNNIKYRGSSYIVIRGGKPVAAIVPVETIHHEQPLGKLRDMFRAMPQLDADDCSFANDVLDSVKAQPLLPEETIWE
jgi:prevent-host-death family protein